MFKMISKLLGGKKKKETKEISPKNVKASDIREQRQPQPEQTTEPIKKEEQTKVPATMIVSKKSGMGTSINDMSKLLTKKSDKTMSDLEKADKKDDKTGMGAAFSGNKDGVQEKDLKDSIKGLKSFIDREITSMKDKIIAKTTSNADKTTAAIDGIKAVTKDNLQINKDGLAVQKESLEEAKDAAYRLAHKAKEKAKKTFAKAVTIKNNIKAVPGKIKEKAKKAGGIMGMIAKLLGTAYLVKKFWPLIKEKLFPFIQKHVWPMIKEKLFPFIQKHVWPMIKEKLFPFIQKHVWSMIKEKLFPFIQKHVWPMIKENIGKIIAGLGIGAMLMNPIGTLKLAVKSLFGLGKFLTKTLFKAGAGIAKFTWKKLSPLVGKGLKGLVSIAGKGLKKLSSIAGKGLSKVIELGKEGLLKLKEAAMKKAGPLIDKTKKIAKKVGSKIAETGTKAFNAAKKDFSSAVDAAKKGIKSTVDIASKGIGKASSIAGKALDATKKGFASAIDAGKKGFSTMVEAGKKGFSSVMELGKKGFSSAIEDSKSLLIKGKDTAKTVVSKGTTMVKAGGSKLAEKFTDLKTSLGNKFTKLGEGVGKKLSGFSDSFKGFGEKFKGLGEKFTGMKDKLSGFGEKFAGFGEKFKGMGSKLSKVSGKIGSIAKNLLDKGIGGAVKIAKGLGGMLKMMKPLAKIIPFLGVIITVLDLIDAFFPDLKTHIMGMFNLEKIKEFGVTVWEKIKDIVGGIGDWISEKVTGVITMIRNGLALAIENHSIAKMVPNSILNKITGFIRGDEEQAKVMKERSKKMIEDSEKLIDNQDKLRDSLENDHGVIDTGAGKDTIEDYEKFKLLPTSVIKKLLQGGDFEKKDIKFMKDTLKERSSKNLEEQKAEIKKAEAKEEQRKADLTPEQREQEEKTEKTQKAKKAIESRTKGISNLKNVTIKNMVNRKEELISQGKDTKDIEKAIANMKIVIQRMVLANEKDQKIINSNTKPANQTSDNPKLAKTAKKDNPIAKMVEVQKNQFNTGGHTGEGDSKEIAGVVHYNEFVLSEEMLKEIEDAETEGKKNAAVKKAAEGKGKNAEDAIKSMLNRGKPSDFSVSINGVTIRLTNAQKEEYNRIGAQPLKDDFDISNDLEQERFIDKISSGEYKDEKAGVVRVKTEAEEQKTLAKEIKKVDESSPIVKKSEDSEDNLGGVSKQASAEITKENGSTFTPEPVVVKAKVPNAPAEEKGPKSVKDIKESDIFKGKKLTNMNPDVEHNVKAMGFEYKEKFGEKIQLNSTGRSVKEQTKLYNDMLKKNKGVSDGSVASPGGSMHNYGLAIDAQSNQLNIAESSGLMSKYGFHRPVHKRDGSLETWHMEPNSITAKDKANIRAAGKSANKKGLDVDKMSREGHFTKGKIQKVDGEGLPLNSKPKEGPAAGKELAAVVTSPPANETGKEDFKVKPIDTNIDPETGEEIEGTEGTEEKKQDTSVDGILGSIGSDIGGLLQSTGMAEFFTGDGGAIEFGGDKIFNIKGEAEIQSEKGLGNRLSEAGKNAVDASTGMAGTLGGAAKGVLNIGGTGLGDMVAKGGGKLMDKAKGLFNKDKSTAEDTPVSNDNETKLSDAIPKPEVEEIKTKSHTAGKGDSLEKISANEEIPLPKLIKWNSHIVDPENISEGDKINLEDPEIAEEANKKAKEAETKVQAEAVQSKKDTALSTSVEPKITDIAGTKDTKAVNETGTTEVGKSKKSDTSVDGILGSIGSDIGGLMKSTGLGEMISGDGGAIEFGGDKIFNIKGESEIMSEKGLGNRLVDAGKASVESAKGVAGAVGGGLKGMMNIGGTGLGDKAAELGGKAMDGAKGLVSKGMGALGKTSMGAGATSMASKGMDGLKSMFSKKDKTEDTQDATINPETGKSVAAEIPGKSANQTELIGQDKTANQLKTQSAKSTDKVEVSSKREGKKQEVGSATKKLAEKTAQKKEEKAAAGTTIINNNTTASKGNGGPDMTLNSTGVNSNDLNMIGTLF